MGPTASGKSNLAMKLRKYLPIELISVDSALIYRYMNIGTAKPNCLQLLKHPHRLVDCKDPSDFYSAAEFRLDALREIEDILYSGKIPLLVGGTMFYYNILLNGISHLPKSNFHLRKRILSSNIYNKSNYLYNYLFKIDSESCKNIHPNDSQRLLRALEICLITGKKFSELNKIKNHRFPYKLIQFAHIPDKKYLHYKIKSRFYKMLHQGLELEVKSLFYRTDLNINLPSMRCIGYRYMWLYLSNMITYHEMIVKSLSATRKLVKRQMTWIRNWKNVHYLYTTDVHQLIQEVLNVLNEIECLKNHKNSLFKK
ncbi:tRNA (adenosine(37)-N6)-dimethylallyltransferase MiaA [Buchnera aphidicola]|uniref:tRNA (adenosine(37)-N6)-dimethylallyltransferase MiaA n=1 Tax=Buchnera aphidicola TaxID=9 RepID=UPI003464DDA3